jgi:hypothetical protein
MLTQQGEAPAPVAARLTPILTPVKLAGAACVLAMLLIFRRPA